MPVKDCIRSEKMRDDGAGWLFEPQDETDAGRGPPQFIQV
jgi:hypothetical protein